MADPQVPRTRYRSITADSARWDGFAFRPGDVVISTPPKCGTTWMQMLCALLIFDGPAFPAPLDEVSPWLEMCIRPLAEVTAALAAQTHRRFIKTHTPLDGLPLHADVTYVVVGRDPRDVMISFEHHARQSGLRALPGAARRGRRQRGPRRVAGAPRPVRGPGRAVPELRRRRDARRPPTLASVLHHLDTGWQRRHEPNVALFHYADLTGRPRGGAAPPGGRPRHPVLTGTCAGARGGGEPGPDARARCRRRAERVAGDLEGRARLLPERRKRRVARRASPPPTSPRTRRGSRSSSARISPPGRTAAGSRRASIPTAEPNSRSRPSPQAFLKPVPVTLLSEPFSQGCAPAVARALDGSRDWRSGEAQIGHD